MDVGGRTGLIAAAEKMGMTPEEFTRKGSYMDALQKGGAIKAFAEAVKNGTLSEESLMKIGAAGILKTAAGAEMLDMMASKAGGYDKLAEWDYAQLGANIEAFGSAEKYQEFLKKNADLSQGQQQGLINAAKTLDWDLKKWGEHAAKFDAMKRSGVLDKFSKGEISGETLKELGEIGFFSEKGQMDAKKWLANRYFGGNTDKMEEHLGKYSGMDTITRLDEMKKIASKVGGMENLMRAKNRTGNYSFSDEEANALGLKKGGDYHIAWGKNGEMAFFSRHSGSQTQDGNFGKSGNSNEQVDKNTVSMALDFRNPAHRELFDGLKSAGKNVQWGDMVNATYTSHGELSTWDIRRGGEIIASDYELSKEGKMEIQHDNVTKKEMGTTVSGSVNTGLARFVNKVTFGYVDQKEAEAYIGAAQGTVHEVSGLVKGLQGTNEVKNVANFKLKGGTTKEGGGKKWSGGGKDSFGWDGDY